MYFATILKIAYNASGRQEPIERFFASMFGSYYEKTGSQPSCAVVNAILRGIQLPPRKLLRYYSDLAHPRCPEKLRCDLQALIETCFADGVRRRALRRVLEDYVSTWAPEEAADLRKILAADDLAQNFAVLCWHALTVDYEQA